MMKGKFDKAMFEEDCSFVEEILNVPRKIAKKIVNGESFYNPLTKRIQTKESLLKGDCDRRADRIKQWIDKEEKRISDFPGYDGVEPYLMYAKDTVDMLRSNSPSYNIRKFKETKEPTRKEKDMPKKKKEKAPQEEPAKTVRASSDGETPKEKKAESQSAAQGETQAERKPREPQMVTVNGDKVTHGHAYQSNVNPQDWYFTARLNGEQLKPQKMDPADVAAYDKKEITVPELMQRYYPTKLMPRVPEEAFKYPNGLAGPSGPITIDKFNVYKETDETRADYGRYKFYAQVGDKKMSTPASREDLNAYFDRVMTPGQRRAQFRRASASAFPLRAVPAPRRDRPQGCPRRQRPLGRQMARVGRPRRRTRAHVEAGNLLRRRLFALQGQERDPRADSRQISRTGDNCKTGRAAVNGEVCLHESITHHIT